MSKYSIQDIESALDKLADFIAGGHEKFLPVYERLERDYEEALQKKTSMDRVLKRANRTDLQNGIQSDLHSAF